MQVTPNQLVKEMRNLRSDCSTGVDQIPVRFIKLVATDLASPLTHIINACIDSSMVPSLWKIARISPIPKVDRPVMENYRPVSILPTLSKVFERIMLKQLIKFIEEVSLFGPCNLTAVDRNFTTGR